MILKYTFIGICAIMMTLIPDKAISMTKKFEGFKAKPYTCPAGKLTIGYGHVIRKLDKLKQLTEDDATELLVKDLEISFDTIDRNVAVYLTQNQLSALVSLVHNIGSGNFVNSTLLKKLNSGDYNGASKEFKRWNRVNGKVMDGLTIRREEEYKCFITPDEIETIKK